MRTILTLFVVFLLVGTAWADFDWAEVPLEGNVAAGDHYYYAKDSVNRAGDKVSVVVENAFVVTGQERKLRSQLVIDCNKMTYREMNLYSSSGKIDKEILFDKKVSALTALLCKAEGRSVKKK
jgi:hypothetical protein